MGSDVILCRCVCLCDVCGAFASCERAKNLIDWEAHLSIEDAIRHAFEWDAKREDILRYD